MKTTKKQIQKDLQVIKRANNFLGTQGQYKLKTKDWFFEVNLNGCLLCSHKDWDGVWANTRGHIENKKQFVNEVYSIINNL